ncbi:hypothetical protein Nepgr_026065 [Nepenthes gracilis]|uniref:DUF1421 domain-containing protein n=1 Tax=Nepenthes gracilis TaxID=150966 RepID=A0AAD3Y024_NEPGR|nr:hypothetical protein Nepgr_026065 [Nepenthes gracilis]
MNASKFMDKQIMDLSQSKGSNDFMDLTNPQDEGESQSETEGREKKEEILLSYDFQPIRPIGVSSSYSGSAVNSSNHIVNSTARNSADKSYGYLDSHGADKVFLVKSQNNNEIEIVSEIDRTVKKHFDNLLHSLDGLSARLTQLESRMSHLENSIDDLKLSIGNNHGSTDGKMRQLENIFREVQTVVQNLKDKQELEAQTHLSKLEISKAEKTPEYQSNTHVDPIQLAASAPQQSNQEFPVALQQLPTLPPFNAPPPPPPQQTYNPPIQLPSPQFPQGQIPSVPQRASFFPPPSQTQEAASQPYQMPPPQQRQPPPASQHQQFQPAPSPPYVQPPQQHTAVATINHPPQLHPPPMGHHEEEGPYIIPSQGYLSNPQQHSQTSTGAPKQFYTAPSHMYEPSSGRSGSGLTSAYVAPPESSEPYNAYNGSPSRYGSSSSVKPQSHMSGSGSHYPQIPTARVLPQAIPTASPISSGSGSGGTGNRVPIDDVVDKVTGMGFPREHVRATVRKLIENGQAVDLNVVLDRLMNGGQVPPQRG